MTKAVFIDYTGTILTKTSRDVEEMVARVCKHSDMHDPREFTSYWWGMIKEYGDACNGDAYLTEDGMVDRMLARCEAEIRLRENLDELHVLCRRFWMYAPFFEDVSEFFRKCPCPIYVISNNGEKYIAEAMRVNGLSPAGIVTADMVRAHKPHPALFRKALEVAGCGAAEAVHIGDSVTSDVQGAQAVGIRAILLDRDGKSGAPGAPAVRTLLDALALI